MGGWFTFADRGSLRLRLTVAVLVTVLAVAGVATVVDYSRQYDRELTDVLHELEEHAQAMQMARHELTEPGRFAGFMARFSRQLDGREPDDCVIVLLNAAGEVVLSSRNLERSEIDALKQTPNDSVLKVGRRPLAQVRLRDTDGSTIIAMRPLDDMRSALRGQLIRRLVVLAVVVEAVTAIIGWVLKHWLLKPVYRLDEAAQRWGRGEFSVRAAEGGSSELAMLARAFNGMAGQLQKEDDRHRAEMRRAQVIQKALLPTAFPLVKGLTIAAEYRPVDHVAGDLYDIIALPDGRTAFAVLDVSGHGIGSALLTGALKMSLDRRMMELLDPAKAIALVSEDLSAYAADDRFATACVGVWNPANRTWTYCAAGHPGGVLMSADGHRVMPTTGPLLGLNIHVQWSNLTVNLKPGDRVFLYTDGVVDAGTDDNRLGIEGLMEILEQSGDVSLVDQLAAVMHGVRQREGGTPGDDVTMVAVRVV